MKNLSKFNNIFGKNASKITKLSATLTGALFVNGLIACGDTTNITNNYFYGDEYSSSIEEAFDSSSSVYVAKPSSSSVRSSSSVGAGASSSSAATITPPDGSSSSWTLGLSSSSNEIEIDSTFIDPPLKTR